MIKKISCFSEKGFTLIELMIVVAIIGILAAIAVPNFIEYRLKGFNSQAYADARNFYNLSMASTSGQSDYNSASDGLPAGYNGKDPVSGAFIYTASTQAITCDALFRHPSGTKTYKLDSTGTITEE